MGWLQDFLKATQQVEAFPTEFPLNAPLLQVLGQAVLISYGPWTKFGPQLFFFFLISMVYKQRIVFAL